MNLKPSAKLVILIVTAVLAAAAVTWAAVSYFSLHNASVTGYVAGVELINGENGSDVKSAVVVVRNDKAAYVFEFTPDTKLTDINGKSSTFYYIKTSDAVTVKYDASVKPQYTSADYFAKSAAIVETRGN